MVKLEASSLVTPTLTEQKYLVSINRQTETQSKLSFTVIMETLWKPSVRNIVADHFMTFRSALHLSAKLFD